MIHFTNSALFGGLGLPLAIWHGVVDAPSPRLVADSVKVLFVTAGWAILRRGRQRVPLRPGNVIVIPRQQSYSIAPEGLMHAVAIYLRPDFLEAHLRWLPGTHPLMHQLTIAHAGSDTAGVVDIGLHGVQALRPKLSVLSALSSAPAAEFAMLARVADVFDQVAFLVSRNDGGLSEEATLRPVIPHKPVVAAARALHHHLDHAWTVGELAREAAISESQLTRLFRQDLGVSPAAYLWNARTDRMAEMLAGCDITVSEASRAVGWEYESAAGRAFKRRYGMSPRAFVAVAQSPALEYRASVIRRSAVDSEGGRQLV